MMMTVFQTLGEALGSVFSGLALIAIAIMVLGIGFIIFALVLIIFLVKRHKDKKNVIVKATPRKGNEHVKKKGKN